MIHRIPCAVALLLGALAVDAQQRTAATRAATPAVPPSKPTSSLDLVRVEPVILARSSLDDKVVALRLAPRIATSIRLPEPVNSVVVGDPENFQAEHSEREPNLVTVKPVTEQPAQTNLLITTALGHQLNLLLLSPGEQAGGSLPVDVLLTYGKPKPGSFLVEETTLPTSLVAETTRLAAETKPLTNGTGPDAPTVTQLVGLLKTGASEAPGLQENASSEGLDKLLERQRRAPLPTLYGQKPGEIEAGQRLKAGVSEVIDGGKSVIVLFSVINPANHAIELMPPQVQLGGKTKKKWTTAEQLPVTDFRLSTRRLGAGARADGVVVFERPAFKQANETLFLQMADSGAVDKPALAPIGFGISTFRGGSAYGAGENNPNQ
jgi:hypothetical protein